MFRVAGGDDTPSWVRSFGLAIVGWAALVAIAFGQEPDSKTGSKVREPVAVPSPNKDDLTAVPTKVDVEPIARDEAIGNRIQSVLAATGWFQDPRVVVENGVVFLNGQTESDELKKWAGDLARSTQDVVAVANRIKVDDPSIWDFSAAWSGLMGLWRDCIRSLPFVIFGMLILALFAVLGRLATRLARVFFLTRIQATLLRRVLAIAAGSLVFLIGIYVVLRVSGLTELALTVVGGTGLIGLAVGIAFRDITENFLASVFLSVQRPFVTNDLIEIGGITGYVQQLNVRTTIVMSLEGNLVQIPNSLVYKSTLRNFTTNPNRKENFVIGIKYEASIESAQEIAMAVLTDHPAVLSDPEPIVLADSFGPNTVNLRVYFWLNGHEHSWLKVKSSVMRLVKHAFQEQGIPIPDESSAIVFPQGLAITRALERPAEIGIDEGVKSERVTDSLPVTERVSTKAEAGLSSEASLLEEQARRAQPLGEQENLLNRPADLDRK